MSVLTIHENCMICGERHEGNACPLVTLSNSGDPAAMGFAHGYLTGEYVSTRQAEEQFPNWSEDQIRCYLNGRDDGVADDWWRIRRAFPDLPQ